MPGPASRLRVTPLRSPFPRSTYFSEAGERESRVPENQRPGLPDSLDRSRLMMLNHRTQAT